MADATTFDQLPILTERPVLNPAPVALGAAVILAGALYLDAEIAWRQAALFLVGVFAGLVLYHAAFGFTTSWRVFISDRRGAGLRAQMLMLAITCALFFPVLASGHAFGHDVRGFVSPVGLSVIIGAFMFGVGMQLGGGCASGTLYTAGGGNARMLVTLASFIAGSVIGAAQMPWWQRTPALKPMSLVAIFGAGRALALSFVFFAAIGVLTIVLERRRHGRVVDTLTSAPPGGLSALAGPWPLVAGAVGLALVNILTLAISGHPWGVTSAFALWGGKALYAAGVPITHWGAWSSPAGAAQIRGAVAADVTSVMDIGIMLGALVASGLAGRFSPGWRVPARSLAAAVIGGLLLGYGARIAYGCNIGALFSGISSGSVHGWLWLVSAYAGNAAGTGFRPLFGLRVERTVC